MYIIKKTLCRLGISSLEEERGNVNISRHFDWSLVEAVTSLFNSPSKGRYWMPIARAISPSWRGQGEELTLSKDFSATEVSVQVTLEMANQQGLVQKEEFSISRHFDWSATERRNLKSGFLLSKDFSTTEVSVQVTLGMTDKQHLVQGEEKSSKGRYRVPIARAISPSLRGQGEEFYNRISRLNKIILMLLLLFPVFAQAQKAPVLPLDSILQRIDANNLLLKSYGLKAEAYQYNAKAATAWMAPMVGVGTFMTPYPGQMIMDGRDKGSLMLQLEQDIPNFAKQNAQKKYIESKAKVERASRDVTLNDFRTQAKKLYYTWLVAQQKIAVLDKSTQIMQTMKKIEEIRYPFNQSKLGSVYQTTAKLEETENMKRMQLGEIGKAKAWLNSLMNRAGNTDFAIDSAYQPQFVAALNLDTASLAMARKDIQKMDYNIQSMQLNIASMKKQSKPDFKLRFDHMSPLGSGMPKAFSVMGMVSIPIAPWSSKMYKSEVKGMQYEVESMQMEKAAMLQETQGMLYGMQYQIKTMEQQIAAMEKKIIPTLQKTLDVSMLSYRENKMELPEVIAAWEALNMMQSNVLDEKLKLYLMIADYEKELYQ